MLEKPKNESDYISFKIYSETTIKDIQKIWPKIYKLKNEVFGHKQQKQYKRKNLDRDLFICYLKMSGDNCKTITKIINYYFKNKPISYQDVSKIIERIIKAR